MTNDYTTGKIYFIKSKNSEKLYIGHTIQPLQIRLAKHKTDFKGYYGIDENKPRTYRSSFDILCEDDFDIFLLQDYPCENKNELEKQEAKWIIKMKNVFQLTNQRMPYSLSNEDIEDIKNLQIPKLIS
jgi:hypothetical protein|tara:strand:- start:693 stop:1076 length:384 start_codon:yes stop_codon:yes gene_type:complete